MMIRQPLALLVVNGMSRSACYEASRLCGPQITVCEATDFASSLARIATMVPGPIGRPSLVDRFRGTGTRVAVLAFASQERQTFDLSDARSRLTLLAWLSSLVPSSGRTVDPPTLGVPLWLQSSLHLQVAQIQLALDLHLMERSLACRLDVSTSAIRRWFRREGTVCPRQFLMGMRGYAIATYAAHFNLVSTAEALGFEHTDSMRRTLRKLGTCHTRLRGPDDLAQFERDLAAIIYPRV